MQDSRKDRIRKCALPPESSHLYRIIKVNLISFQSCGKETIVIFILSTGYFALFFHVLFSGGYLYCLYIVKLCNYCMRQRESVPFIKLSLGSAHPCFQFFSLPCVFCAIYKQIITEIRVCCVIMTLIDVWTFFCNTSPISPRYKPTQRGKGGESFQGTGYATRTSGLM